MTQQNGTATAHDTTAKTNGEKLGEESTFSEKAQHKASSLRHDAADALSLENLQRLFSNGSLTLDQVRGRVAEEIRNRPLIAIGVASALGFILGGGFRTKGGRKMLKRALAYGLANYEKLVP